MISRCTSLTKEFTLSGSVNRCKVPVWVFLGVLAELKPPAEPIFPIKDRPKDIFDIRRSIGMEDPREGLQECELCQNDSFTGGQVCPIPPSSGAAGNGTALNNEAESVVKAITEQIIAGMK